VAAVARVRGGGGRGGCGGGAAVWGVRGRGVAEAGLAARQLRVWGQGGRRGGGRGGGDGVGARRGRDGRALQDLVADAARLPVPASAHAGGRLVLDRAPGAANFVTRLR
jgi:hypothetical protein